jgi:hypothetical protein
VEISYWHCPRVLYKECWNTPLLQRSITTSTVVVTDSDTWTWRLPKVQNLCPVSGVCLYIIFGNHTVISVVTGIQFRVQVCCKRWFRVQFRVQVLSLFLHKFVCKCVILACIWAGCIDGSICAGSIFTGHTWSSILWQPTVKLVLLLFLPFHLMYMMYSYMYIG